MNIKKGLYIFIPILILVTTLTALYFLNTGNNEYINEVENKLNLNTEIDEDRVSKILDKFEDSTSENTYSNNELGLRLKYPNNWTKSEREPTEDFKTITFEKEGHAIQISINKNINIEDMGGGVIELKDDFENYIFTELDGTYIALETINEVRSNNFNQAKVIFYHENDLSFINDRPDSNKNELQELTESKITYSNAYYNGKNSFSFFYFTPEDSFDPEIVEEMYFILLTLDFE